MAILMTRSRRQAPERFDMQHLPAFIDKMKKENLPQVVIDAFTYYYEQVIQGSTGMISDKEIRPVNPEEIADIASLSSYASAGQTALDQAVLIVLNGGLGTSMGLTGPKSLLKVRDDKTFLQIIIEQAAALGTRLAFMNSFNTHAATQSAVEALKPENPPRFFLQNKFPKILRETYAPVYWPENPEMEWNPPGHGEIYTALATSGLLEDFLKEGTRYALIVNADNLGATMHPALLGYFVTNGFPFMMEVAQRTPMDMKGGHIARHGNGRLILREIAQCPREDLAAFQDIQHYRYFNVNSLWVDLQALASLLNQNGVIQLPMILNPKTVDPRNPDSPAVYQIETAMGAAISLFEGAKAVEVSDIRFRPVKKCAELLAMRSDCFVFQPDGILVPNPDRRLATIQIKLDPAYYGKIDDFEQRFAQGVPSLIDCEALTIKGDVRFEKEVMIRGSIRIYNPGPKPAVVKAGTLIEENIEF
jgi:UTP--glucose-1-phosphate uridylyltransferase